MRCFSCLLCSGIQHLFHVWRVESVGDEFEIFVERMTRLGRDHDFAICDEGRVTKQH